MAINLAELLTILNTSNLQKNDPKLYDFLRRLLNATQQVDKVASATAAVISSGGGSGVTNITNLQQIIQYNEESDGDGGGGAPGTQGQKGDTGATGPAGQVSLVVITEDPILEDPIVVKGDTGLTGSQGIQGAVGQSLYIEPELPEEPLHIPGQQGLTGSTGATGSQGLQGISVLIEPELPEEPSVIVGPTGPIATMLDFTQDLGSGESSGTFDITTLSGLTADQDVTIVQTAQPIASKGNARDEFEMDAIQLTGYVVNSTTIRVYWWSPNIVVGIYAFALAVSPGAIAASINGKVQQIVSTQSSALATGATAIPADDTIPQITEGDEYMTLAITPKNSLSTLLIQVLVTISNQSGSRSMIAALFQDSTANALSASMQFSGAANAPVVIPINYTMPAGTTSSTTFRVRAGTNGGGTNTFNGFSGARMFGAIPKSSIVITEYLS